MIVALSVKLKLLNLDEIRNIYQTRMVIDFPEAELKPLKYIIEAVNAGIYECLGLYENEECIGYTFLVRQGNNYLTEAETIIAEVENPEYASCEEDK